VEKHRSLENISHIPSGEAKKQIKMSAGILEFLIKKRKKKNICIFVVPLPEEGKYSMLRLYSLLILLYKTYFF
jgi:hypothetical protein